MGLVGSILGHGFPRLELQCNQFTFFGMELWNREQLLSISHVQVSWHEFL